MEWFKFYHNKWLTDRAINSLRPQDRLCFITLLCVTSQSDERNGLVLRYDEEEIILLTQLKIDVHDDQKSDYHLAVGFTERLISVGILERVDATTILIKNFEKRQNSNLLGSERAKRYRENSKAKARVTNVTKKSDERNAREEKIREDKIREEKKYFGEFQKVQLSDGEHTNLRTRYGAGATTRLIDELDGYLETSGKRYKSHYATLLNWARRKGIEIVVARPAPEPEELTQEQIEQNKKRIAAIRGELTEKMHFKT